jgi:hypothetical protein
LGGIVVGLACFADPYAVVLAAPIAAFGAACAADRRRIAALAGGGLLGALPFALLHAAARAKGGVLGLSPGLVAHNARLLVEPCLAWTLGLEAFGSRGAAIVYGKLATPPGVAALQIAGGALFFGALVVGGACAFLRPLRWPLRRFAIAGGLGLVVTIAGFLASPMVMDLFSARYLAAITLLSPFALAPVAALLGRARFAVLVAPCVLATGLGGWLGRGPLGHWPPEGADDEARLEAALALRGLRYATADYWTAYRLTFLARERVIVVPVNDAEDRYAPYKVAFDGAPVVAYVFDPLRSREQPGWMEARVRAGDTVFDRDVDAFSVGRFSVLVLRRPVAAGSCSPPSPRTSPGSTRTSPG